MKPLPVETTVEKRTNAKLNNNIGLFMFSRLIDVDCTWSFIDDHWKSPMETKTQSFITSISRSIYRPILLLTLEPMCLNLCIFSAILLGILYLLFGAFQLVFGQVYEFTLWQRGCSFLGLLVGMIAAILTDPFWRWNYTGLERASMPEISASEIPAWMASTTRHVIQSW